MLDRSNVKTDLFDMYIEVGEIALLSHEDADCAYIEIWVGSVFSKTPAREECKTMKRRPISEIVKQVLGLCGRKKAFLFLMCDDTETWADTIGWGSALYLLLRELSSVKKLQGTVVFTPRSPEQVEEYRSSCKFRRERDREDFLRFLDLVDVLVAQQANRFAGSQNRKFLEHSRTEGCLPHWNWILQQ